MKHFQHEFMDASATFDRGEGGGGDGDGPKTAELGPGAPKLWHNLAYFFLAYLEGGALLSNFWPL